MTSGVAPRALILRAVDPLLDHPGPTTVRLQRTVMLYAIECAILGFRLGRWLWRR